MELYGDKRKKSKKKWVKNNPDKVKATTQRYLKKHPEKSLAKNRKRRADKKNVEHENYSTEDIINIYGTKCYLCKKEIDLSATRRTGFGNWQDGLQLDHVIPISKGGSDTIKNVRPAHGLCNLRKGVLPSLPQ